MMKIERRKGDASNFVATEEEDDSSGSDSQTRRIFNEMAAKSFKPYEEDYARIERALSIIYCRSTFNDFRRPVELLYPALAEPYLRGISQPMDVGTLLLKATRREFESFPSMMEQLKLVHENSVTFNESSPTLVAMSKHLKMFAAGIVEEIVRHRYEYGAELPACEAAVAAMIQQKIPPGPYSYPYKYPLARKPYLEKLSRRFTDIIPHHELLWRRRLRLQMTADTPLNRSEQELLRCCINEVATMLLQPTLGPAIPQIMHSITELLHEALAAAGETTLRSVLFPIVRECLLENVPVERTCLWPDIALDMFFSVGADHRGPALKQENVAFLQELDDAIGVLLVKIEERYHRGISSSSVWAHPSPVFVWAQPLRDSRNAMRSPWLPCMILASSFNCCSDNHSPFAMDPSCMATNLSRIPADMLQQLMKVRPRIHQKDISGGGSSSCGLVLPTDIGDFSIPEGLLLLEYFGSHDFGWARSSDVALYTNRHGEIMPAPEGKLCAMGTQREAEEAISAWLEQQRNHGEASPDDIDLIAPPSLAELTDSVRVRRHRFQQRSIEEGENDATLIFDNVAHDGAMSSGRENKKSSSSKRSGANGRIKIDAVSESDVQTSRMNPVFIDASHCNMYDLLNHCINSDGRSFSVSRCPIPNPLPAARAAEEKKLREALRSSPERPASSFTTEAAIAALEDRKNIKQSIRFNMKAIAVLRARVASLWLDQVRPLYFDQYTPTSGPRQHNGIDIDQNADHERDIASSRGGKRRSGSGRSHTDSLLTTASASGRKSRDKAMANVAAATAALDGDDEGSIFRENVEYAIPQECTAEFLSFRCINSDNRFVTSTCPLSVPLTEEQVREEVEYRRAVVEDAGIAQHHPHTEGGDLAASDRKSIPVSKRINFKRNAMLRARALSVFIETMKPLHLNDYVATKGPRLAQIQPPSFSIISSMSDEAGNDVFAGDEAGNYWCSEPERYEALRLDASLEGVNITDPPLKRKYVFKNRSTTGEDISSKATIPSYMIGASSNNFTLESGVTRFAGGEGLVYTRSVPKDASIFFYESKSRNQRKERLRMELQCLNDAIQHIQALADQRQHREEGRKVKKQNDTATAYPLNNKTSASATPRKSKNQSVEVATASGAIKGQKNNKRKLTGAKPTGKAKK